jgi:hypothetical protein
VRHWKLNRVVVLIALAAFLLVLGGQGAQSHQNGVSNGVSKATTVDHSTSYDSPDSAVISNGPLPVVMPVCWRVGRAECVVPSLFRAPQSTIRPPPFPTA